MFKWICYIKHLISELILASLLFPVHHSWLMHLFVYGHTYNHCGSNRYIQKINHDKAVDAKAYVNLSVKEEREAYSIKKKMFYSVA